MKTAQKHLMERYLLLCAGLVIMAFGVAFSIKGGLGTSPISSLPYVLSFRFPVTLGQFTFAMNLFFILGQVLLLRRDFQPIQLLQVAVNAVFSAFIDVSMGLLSWLEISSLPMAVLVLVLGCAVLAFGISVEVAPRVLMVPGEGIVQAIAAVTGWRFGNVKTAFDATLVSTALLLSLELFAGDSYGMFTGQSLGLFAVCIAVSYMLSGYYGLYSEQKILYSKLRPEFINKKANEDE